MATVAIEIILISIFLITSVDARGYTLTQLLDEAVRNSKQLRSIEYEMRKAEAQVQEVLGQGMPQVSASVNISHNVSSLDVDQNKFQTATKDVLNNPDITQEDQKLATALLNGSARISGEMIQTPDNVANATLDVQQVVFAQGKVGLGLKIAKTYQRTLLCKYNAEKMKLKSEVTTLYLKAILSQKNIIIASEALSLSEQNHRLAVITHLVGRASELDTLTSRLNHEKASIELQKAQSSQRIVYQAVLVQTGINIPVNEFSVEGDFEETDFTLSIEEVLQKMKWMNPTLEQLRGNGEIKKLQVNLARAEFYPFIYAGASISGMGMFDNVKDASNPLWGNEKKVYVGLRWDIFSGLSKFNHLRQAEADRDMYKVSMQKITEDLELQTKTLYEQVLQSKVNLVSCMSVIKLAEKRFQIAKKAYEVGSATFIDLQNAEFELNSAKIAFNTAQFTYQSALISLRLLMNDF